MQGLRSRAGIVAMTAGAIALLSVPVVALAKGPPDAVGGGNETAKNVASPQANIPDTNPGQAKKPPPAPKATPPGHAKRAGQPAAPAGGSAGGGTLSAPPRRAARKAKAHAAPPAHAKAYGHKTPPGHAKRQSQEPAEGSSDPGSVNQPASPDKSSGSPDKPPRPDSPEKLDPTGPLDLPSADSPESSDGNGGIPAAVVSDTVELPENASPETLPFTGIQLGLLALIGLTSLVGGFALRRGAIR